MIIKILDLVITNNPYLEKINIFKEQFPFYIIFISIDPSKIDINVHPTKTEIKIEDEKNINQILRAVVRRALASHIQVPEEKGFDDNKSLD